MTNERLRSQLAAAGLSPSELATRIEVDPKTVERWISTGRVPFQRHRLEVAQALSTDELYLWPDLAEDDRAGVSQAEIRAVYPFRGAVPDHLWRRLIDDVTDSVDVLVYSGLFLLDNHPDLPTRLMERAGAGLTGRLLYGDPDSGTVAWRGEEEGIGDNLAARIRLSLKYLEPVRDVDGIDLRLHDTVLYNSIYRFDDEMLINTHVVGSPAPQNPVLHLRKVPGGHLFQHYLASFERTWAAAG